MGRKRFIYLRKFVGKKLMPKFIIASLCTLYSICMIAVAAVLVTGVIKREILLSSPVSLFFRIGWTFLSIILSTMGIILLWKFSHTQNLIYLWGGLTFLPIGVTHLLIIFGICQFGPKIKETVLFLQGIKKEEAQRFFKKLFFDRLRGRMGTGRNKSSVM